MKIKFVLLIVIALIGFTAFRVWTSDSSAPDNQGSRDISKGAHEFPLDDPTSPWVLVNKDIPLKPLAFKPYLTNSPMPTRASITDDEAQIASVISRPLRSLVDAASKDGITLELQSGYRSYESQKRLYDSSVQREGQAAIDEFLAKPGHSEHQTGLAVDLGGISNPACNVRPCFAETSEGKWLKDNARTYGFIIRYPESKQAVTGYEYEPWHLRYVGVQLAKDMTTKNILTMEEYFKR